MSLLTLLRRYWVDVFLIAFGGISGILMLPVILSSTHWIQELYDKTNPPASMKLIQHERIGDSQTLRMYFSVKRNKDCVFLGFDGYTGMPDGAPLYPADVVEREDGHRPRSYPVGIIVNSPPWILSPVRGPRIVLYGHYMCDNRPIRAQVIDTVLIP